MEAGDLCLFYHSVNEKSNVGIAKVVREHYQDPTTEDERWVVVDVVPETAFKRPVTLADIKADEQKLFFKLQKERVNLVLKELNTLAEQQHFSNWNYPAISLFCLIDWIEFRELHNLHGLTALLDFHQQNIPRIEVTATDPRK